MSIEGKYLLNNEGSCWPLVSCLLNNLFFNPSQEPCLRHHWQLFHIHSQFLPTNLFLCTAISATRAPPTGRTSLHNCLEQYSHSALILTFMGKFAYSLCGGGRTEKYVSPKVHEASCSVLLLPWSPSLYWFSFVIFTVVEGSHSSLLFCHGRRKGRWLITSHSPSGCGKQ